MRRKRQFLRDQDPTPFSSILERLCRDSGALSAALVDAEGETVDFAGGGDPFETRILAAELRLLQQHVQECSVLGSSYEFVIRARRRSFLVESLPDGYALAIELPRRSSSISHRALGTAIRELCHEAGFDRPAHHGAAWSRIGVDEESGGSMRPAAIKVDDHSEELVVLGRLAGDSIFGRERGFRVRLQTGREGNLVREALGRWYLEED